MHPRDGSRFGRGGRAARAGRAARSPSGLRVDHSTAATLRALPGRMRATVLIKIVWSLAAALAIGSLVTAIFAASGAPEKTGSVLDIVLIVFVLLLAAVVLSLLTLRAVTRPLGILARTARQVAAGNLEAHFAQRSNDEIGQLAGALETMKLELRSHLDLIQSQADALRESSLRLTTVRDEERRRLARDLHDGLQQQLVVLRMGIGMAPERVRSGGQQAKDVFAELGAELDRVIERVREVSQDLYPSILRDAGLTAAVRSQAGRLPITTHLSSNPDPLPRLRREIESSAYFIVSEAIANVLKHSGATEATIDLAIENDCLALAVADNGRGFQREADLAGATAGGLTFLDDRIRSLGGRMFVTSGSAGTAIRALLPLNPLRMPARPPGEATPSVDQLLVESSGAGTYVGREEEIDALRAAFESALGGHGSLVLLAGEPGIGKTRTANELATYAASRGAVVLVGRCFDPEGTPAYSPWIQVIRTYVRRRRVEELLEEMGPGATDIAQMDAELATRLQTAVEPPLPPADDAELADPRQARFRLFDSISSFLRRASEARPMLIVVDDLQSADKPSLRLLEFLADTLRTARVLLVGTHRDATWPTGHPLSSTLTGLEIGQLSTTLTLRGLDEREVARFMEVATGRRPSPDLVAAVFSRTEGNPLFVREVVRLLASEGHLQDAAERASWEIDIPISVRDAIERRLDYLSPQCNEVLSVASAIGREFDIGVLQRASDLTPHRLVSAVEEASAARVLVELPTASPRGRSFRFNHALMRETIYGQIPVNQRRRLHRRIGQVLEGIYTGDPNARPAELAVQYQAAGRGRSRAKAIYYSAWAGARAAKLLAFEEAAGHYERALRALGEERGAKGSEPMQCDLLLALGETQWRAGDTPSARKSFTQAATMARRLHDPNRLARAAVGYGEGLGSFEFAEGADDVLVGRLEEALTAIEQWPPRPAGRGRHSPEAAAEKPEVTAARYRVRVLARLAVELYYTDQVDRRASLAQQAVELAQELGDPATELIALYSRFRSMLGPDRLDERLDDAGKIVRLAEEIGDPEMAVRGRHFRLLTLLELGDREALDAALGEWITLAEELRQPLYRWQALCFQAMVALMEGRFAEGETHMREALQTNRQGPGQAAMIRFGAELFFHHWVVGRLDEMEVAARELNNSYPWLPGWRTGLAVIYAEMGRIIDAREHFENLATHDFADLPRDGNWLGSVALCGLVCSFLRDSTRAATLFDLLSPYEDRCIVVHAGAFCLGSAATFLGMLAETLHRFDEAQRLFELGLKRNVALGDRPMAAMTLAHHAAMLTSRNGPGDVVAAMALLKEAGRITGELGMARTDAVVADLTRRAESLARVAGVQILNLEEAAEEEPGMAPDVAPNGAPEAASGVTPLASGG